ncbi:hypothetical protein ACFUEN_29250 [Streptomyces griseorubiginosus]|uniref:hypothetical protein n=1 Tax=Streptomyces griseorubiginosus TaxID=67304 RepID=UPI00363DEC40
MTIQRAEISPDLSDRNRCVSVHWSIPTQCALPPSHWDDHEANHPETGVRLRYCRTGGTWRTEELRDGAWHRLEIPPPGGYCGQPDPDRPGVTCTWQHGHRFSRSHAADVDGEWHQWPTGLRDPAMSRALREDEVLRGLIYQQAAELAEIRAAIAVYQQQFGELSVETGALKAPPDREQRLPRLLTYIQNKGRGVTSARVHRVYVSWAWKGLKPSETRGDLAALAEAGHLVQDDSDPAARVYWPVRTARGGAAR